jgi:competence protein ComEC
MSVGILLAHYIASSYARAMTTFAALSIVCAAAATVLLMVRNAGFSTIFLIAAFVSAGASLAMILPGPASANRIARLFEEGVLTSGDPVEIIGVINGEPEPAPQSFYVTINTEQIAIKGIERATKGTVLLLAHVPSAEIQNEYDGLQLHHGARIRVMTTLAREDEFRNPGVMPFTEYLEREGYDATGAIKSPLLIERSDDAEVFLPLAWVYQWRARLQKEFSQRFSANTAGVLDAALLGNAHNISAGTAERFRAGGTFHILVISGLQIAFIAGLALLIVRRISRRKWIQFALATAFLWAYTFAVGAQASVARAALMFTLVAFAPIVGRRPNSLNTIAAAALVLLVLNPSELFDPSFQLTFVSVLSIVCLAVPLMENMRRVGSWQPTMVSPHPPRCPSWFRKVSEVLFWSERAWKAEMSASNIKYRLFKTPVAAKLESWHLQKPLRFASAAVIVSASVQVCLLPLMILYFHRISLASLLLNIFVGALMAVMAFAALAAILLAQLSATLAAPLIFLAEKTNWLMIHAVDPFSRIGAASVRLPHYSGRGSIVYILYFALLLSLIVAFGRWNPLPPPTPPDRRERIITRVITATAISFVLIFAITIFHPFSAARPDGKLRVDFLDVGQGDSALVTTPDGTTLLIDGGGRPNIDWSGADDDEGFQRDRRSIGERVVSEYLWSRGFDRIDYVIASHADADHIDGLNDVLRNFRVRGAIVARTPSNDLGFARFAGTANRVGVPIDVVAGGDSLQIGDVIIDVLWPPQIANADAPYRNNDGLFLRIRYGAQVLLFAADIEAPSEVALLKSGLNLRSDIVKVAHHGSRTSSTQPFVDATRTQLAIISVGRISIFGHPHKEVVERWRASGARVMTTGDNGTITVVTNGRELNVSTFVAH